ncbi:amidohydrolase family protein [Bacteroidota bacterium]
MKNPVYQFVIISLIFILSSCNTPDYDIVIKGGTIYDGKGGQPYQADIGIIDNMIVKTGKINFGDAIVIEAEGNIVSPGFIDVHTHCSSGLVKIDTSAALNYLSQGVTTVVSGNCGGGTYKVEEYFSRLNSIGIGPNVAHLAGHATIRRSVMGMDDRDPSKEELEEMKNLVKSAMEQGAIGISTGLFYSPGSFTKADEIIELARVIKQYNGIYVSHIRDESNYTIGLEQAIREAILIGEEADIPVQISHIKALGKPVWGLSDEVDAIIKEARTNGIEVLADQYPYTASSTSLAAMVLSRWIQSGGKTRDRLRDPDLLPEIAADITANIERRGGAESLVIVSYRPDSSLVGKSLGEISRETGKNIIETAIWLIIEGNPTTVSFNMNEKDVITFMQKDYVMTSSDGGVQVPGMAMTHPRSYGAFTHKIREYVLDRKIISMEHAIRAATSLPAAMFRLKDRGLIEEGKIADIVIFDPDDIRDNATFDNPHQYSSGIEFLLINGEIVIDGGVFNGKLAGKTIRLQ